MCKKYIEKTRAKIKKGFTLLELMYAMLVLGILMGGGLYLSKASINKAIETTMILDAKTVINKQQENFALKKEYLEQK